MKIKNILRYKRTILLSVLAIACFLSIMSVGPTYAYLKIVDDNTKGENKFLVSQSVNPTVTDGFVVKVGDNTVKNGDTGYSVYVRATIVVTWKNGSEICGSVPVEGTNYTLAYGSNKWNYNDADGYYYYNEAVKSGDETQALITGYSQVGDPPEEGYSISVEILSQTIQAAGQTEDKRPAVTDAWGYTPTQQSNP